jgi:perosamine synthetase
VNTGVASTFIPYGRHSLDETDIAAVVHVLRQGPLTQGPWVEAFERDVAAYVGARYAVAVSSGTAGLHLACLAANLKPGDHAITTPNTFVATANAVAYTGATTVLADIHKDTLNLNPQSLLDILSRTDRVKAILPVHFAGLPCDMPAIREAAKKAGALVIEDSAHALGASYPQGGRVGNGAWSDITVFSFHPVKLIAAGEGGMITTNDERLYRRLLRLRSHGINKLDDPFEFKNQAVTDGQTNPWYYEMQELGFNYRITDIQAALGSSQMKRIDQFLERRLALVQRYDAAFENTEHVTRVQSAGRLQSAHHLYILRIAFDRLNMTRTALMHKLRESGIGTQVHYIPVYKHPYHQHQGHSAKNFPETERYYDEALTLPLYYGLTDADQDHVIATLKSLL